MTLFFRRVGAPCLTMQFISISYQFWLRRNLAKISCSTWDKLTSWYCFISLKRNFTPIAAGSQQCFSDIFRNYCLKEKKNWKKKSMFTSKTRGALTLDPPFLHGLSFLFGSIEMVRRGYHLRRAQVSAPTNIEQHPIIHAALSEVIPLLRTRYHNSSNFTYFSLYTRA